LGCVEGVGIVPSKGTAHPVDAFLMFAQELIKGALIAALGGVD
jgi:hypothetical protein